jgi:hypothetical protein
MFQPATWIQGMVNPNCRSGLEALKRVRAQMEMPKVSREARRADQRNRSFFPEGKSSNASTPRRGEKMTKLRGFVKKFIVRPRVRYLKSR